MRIDKVPGSKRKDGSRAYYLQLAHNVRQAWESKREVVFSFGREDDQDARQAVAWLARSALLALGWQRAVSALDDCALDADWIWPLDRPPASKNVVRRLPKRIASAATLKDRTQREAGGRVKPVVSVQFPGEDRTRLEDTYHRAIALDDSPAAIRAALEEILADLEVGGHKTRVDMRRSGGFARP